MLAAKLANDECERLYQKRPFKAEQHAPILEGNLYRWGRLDPGAPSGLSAAVTFRTDGSQPDVQVYFSTDKRDPPIGIPSLPRLPEPRPIPELKQ